MTWKQHPISQLTKRWWRFSRHNRVNVIIYIILFVIANAIAFVEPLILGWMLNTIQRDGFGTHNISFILFLVSLFVISRFAFWCFHGPARVIENANAFLVRAAYKKYLINGMLRLSPSWHRDNTSGDSIDRIEKGTTALFNFSSMTYEIIDTIVRLVSSYIALAYFNIHAGYLILFVLIITITIIVKFDAVLQPKYRELNRKENHIASRIFDTISNITTVIILRIEKMVASDIGRTIIRPFTLFKKTVAISETKWFLVSMASALMIFLVIGSYLVTIIVTDQELLIGTVYILYGYIERINGLFFRFAYRYGDIIRFHANIQNAEHIEQQFERKKRHKRVQLGNTWNILRIQNLSFSYDTPQTHLHLKNVGFSIHLGEKIAFIGESGSGKSTMLKLIRGLYPPHKVQLYCDNTPIARGFEALSDNIALIPQDPEIFSTTIKQNITFGIRHQARTIRKYTDMARITTTIDRLGWNTSTKEKGVNLSGGEKQRIALARGLLASKDKPIILLDEPTSSVDAHNEQAIYKNIFKTSKEKTIISTIHRLHLLPLFDTIYVFKKGRIVAFGTLKELMATSRDFQQLYKKHQP